MQRKRVTITCLALFIAFQFNEMRAFLNGKNAMAVDKVTIKSEQNAFTVDTKIKDVITDSVFGDYGRLLFPADRGYYSGDTLGKLSLTWYGNINPKRTVEIANFMKRQAEAGDTVFYDIYSEKEKARDLDKKNTGLFFFRGNEGAKTAIVNAGGGFFLSVRCRTVFRMHLSSAKRDIMHLP